MQGVLAWLVGLVHRCQCRLVLVVQRLLVVLGQSRWLVVLELRRCLLLGLVELVRHRYLLLGLVELELERPWLVVLVELGMRRYLLLVLVVLVQRRCRRMDLELEWRLELGSC